MSLVVPAMFATNKMEEGSARAQIAFHASRMIGVCVETICDFTRQARESSIYTSKKNGNMRITETQRSPFLPLALVAEHSQRLNFGTAIAVAFARSPASLAYTAWDLAQASSIVLAQAFATATFLKVSSKLEEIFARPSL